MRYPNLIFDLYGTLVDIHTDENALVWEKTALFFGYYGARYTPEGLCEAFRQAMRAREAAAGQSYECYPDIPVEGVMAELFRGKGITENADALGMQAAQLFRISATEYIRLYPGVREALTHLRQQGYRLYLLSNAQRAFTAFELRHLDMFGLFDAIYLSSDYGCRKPDLRFFRALLQDARLTPAHCLMIGNDRDTDIAGAKAAGMATLYLHTNITPPGQAEADPAAFPGAAGTHWEYEGADWEALSDLILKL